MDPAKERELTNEYGRQTGNSGSGLFFDKKTIDNTAARDSDRVGLGGTAGTTGVFGGHRTDTYDKNVTTTSSSRDKESRTYGTLGSNKEQDTTHVGQTSGYDYSGQHSGSSGYSGQTTSSGYTGQTGYTRSSDIGSTHRSGMTDSIATAGVSSGRSDINQTSGINRTSGISSSSNTGSSGLSNMGSRHETATSNIGSATSSHYDSSNRDVGSMNQGQDSDNKGRVVREGMVYAFTTEEENPEDKRKSNTGIGSSNISGNTSSRS